MPRVNQISGGKQAKQQIRNTSGGDTQGHRNTAKFSEVSLLLHTLPAVMQAFSTCMHEQIIPGQPHRAQEEASRHRRWPDVHVQLVQGMLLADLSCKPRCRNCSTQIFDVALMCACGTVAWWPELSSAPHELC